MAKHLYPAVFTEEKDGYSIIFPDFEGCFSEGDTLEEAYEMAIPAWLNELAVRENVNFSQTLQNALVEQLKIAQ